MAKRAQGAFEYILMLGGILLITVLSVVILKATLWSGKQSVEANTETIDRLTCLPAYIGGRGVVAWYKFDEGSGSVAKDSSGRGRDGTLVGGPTWTSGILKGGLDFAAGAPRYVTIPDPGMAYPAFAVMTLEAWIKRTVIDGDSYIFGIQKGGPGNPFPGNEYISLRTYTNNKLFSHINGVNPDFYGTKALGDTEWHHVAVVFSRNTGGTYDRSIFVDGDPDGVQPNVDRYYDDQTNAQYRFFDIGGYDPNNEFSGVIDNVVFYNRALSSAEIKADYLCGQNAYA